MNERGPLNKCGCRDCCLLNIRSYIHGMKLQVTKAQNVDQMGSAVKNERDRDTCNLKIQSYIYGIRKERKLITNKTKQNEQQRSFHRRRSNC